MKRTYKEKRKNKHIIAVIGLIFAMCIGSGMFGMSGTAATASQMNAKTPLARHGRLSVKGVDLVDQSQKKFQLRGVSTHGINWDVGSPYVNEAAFRTLRDDWGVNAIRLAMYTSEYNGYCSGGDKKALRTKVEEGVQYATKLGMYVIIDWHMATRNSISKKQSVSLQQWQPSTKSRKMFFMRYAMNQTDAVGKRSGLMRSR